MEKLKENDVIENVKILKDLGKIKTDAKHNRQFYMCQCLKCGYIKKVEHYQLIKNKSFKCLCNHISVDLTNQKFEQLTVIGLDFERNLQELKKYED